jgi:hypothetical protein
MKRRLLMKSGRGFFVMAIFLMAAVMVFLFYLKNAEAAPRGGGAGGGPRGGAIEGPRGNVAVEGPRGNIAVGARYKGLPASAKALILNNRTYYVDDSYVYYLPCDDDKTGVCPCDGDDKVYCVVPAPE